jgi:hypothetical protein
MDQFPLGFWNYMDADTQNARDVDTWVHCGMTLTMSPEYRDGVNDKAAFLALLDEAGRQGMKLIVCDHRARWQGASTDESAYRVRFGRALEDFGGHPAVFGFHVGDEPDDEAQADAVAALRIQREMAPALTPFLNHLPYYGGARARVGTELDYVSFLKEFAKASQSKLLCYDCYSQMNPEDIGVQNYFLNLRMFSEAAADAGIPWWTTLLSVGHFRYRCPSEDDIRWQLFTALASGCRGILWFFFYMVNHHNFRLSPIDEHGERTGTYESLSRIQRTFLKKEGPTLARCRATRVAHVNRSYGGYPLFIPDDDELVSAVEATDGLPAILTWYQDEAGERYLSVVNNSWKESIHVTTRLKGEHRVERVDFGPKASELVMAKWGDTSFFRGEGRTEMTTWLAPGQMELYHIVE